MSPGVLMAVSAVGGLGAVLRFIVDGLVARRWGGRLPWGTFVVNVTGSFVLGLVTGASTAIDPTLSLVLGVGLLGGYTTFSTAMWETLGLARNRRMTLATWHAVGMLVAGWIGALGGVQLGSTMMSTMMR